MKAKYFCFQLVHKAYLIPVEAFCDAMITKFQYHFRCRTMFNFFFINHFYKKELKEC